MANLATINNNLLADSGIDPLDLIVGTGTVNYIPKFTAEGTIGNSIMQESGTAIQIFGNAQVRGDWSSTYPVYQLLDTRAGGAEWNIENGRTIGNIEFYNGAAGGTKLTLTPSANLGLGVSPSTWSLGKAIEVGNPGNGIWNYGVSNTNIVTNTIWNAGHKYASNGAATQYAQNNGNHEWLTAPSGIAGNSVSFAQVMTLTTAGALLVGTDSSTNTAAGKIVNRVGGTSSPNLALNGGAWSIASIGGEPALYLSSNIAAATGIPGASQTAKGGIGFEYVSAAAPTDLVVGIFGAPTVASSVRIFNNTERIRIASTGAIRFNAYGSGTFTGTRAYDLSVDASGNIIEVPVGAGTITGGGTAGQVAFFSGASSIASEANFLWDTSLNKLTVTNGSVSFGGLQQDAAQTLMTLSANNAAGQLKSLYVTLIAGGTPEWQITTGAVSTDAGIKIIPNGSNGLTVPFGTTAASFSNSLTVGDDLTVTDKVGIGGSVGAEQLFVYNSMAKVPSASGWGVVVQDTNTDGLAGRGGAIAFGAYRTDSGRFNTAAVAGAKSNSTGGNEDGDLLLYSSVASSLTERIRVLSAGRILMGPTMPTDDGSSALQVSGGNIRANEQVVTYRRFVARFNDTGNLCAELYEDGASTNGGTLTLYGKASGTVDTVISAAPTKLNYINNAANVMIGWSTDQGYKLGVNGSGLINGDLQVGSSSVTSVSFRISRTNASIPADANYFVATANTPNQQWIEGGYWTNEFAGQVTAPNSGYPYFEVWAGQGSLTNKSFGFVNKTSGAFTSTDLLYTFSLLRTGGIKFNQYGSGSFTGTRAYDLAIDSSGNIIEVAVGAGTVTGSGTSGQVTYWNGSSSVTGSTAFTFSPNGQFYVGPTNTAGAGVAYGLNLNPTLVAGANGDVLSSLFIRGTFTNGAFTSVQNWLIIAEGSNNRWLRYNQYGLWSKQNDNTHVTALNLENAHGTGYGVGMNFTLGYDGSGTNVGVSIVGARIQATPETSWTSTASTQDASLLFQTAANGVLGTRFSILSGGTIRLDAYSDNGFVKTSSSTGTITIDTTSYQPLLTNPVTGTGTTNRLPKWTGSTTLGDSLVSDNGSIVRINSLPLMSDSRLAVGTAGGDQTYASIFIGGAITSGTDQYAVMCDPQLAGTNNYAVFANARIKAATAVTNTFGVYIPTAEKLAGATIVDNYALYIANQTSGSGVNYSIYSSGGLNYFGGIVGIGATPVSGISLYIKGNGVDSPLLKMQGFANTTAMLGDTTTGTTDVGNLWLYNDGTLRIRLDADTGGISYINAAKFVVGATSSSNALFRVTTSSNDSTYDQKLQAVFGPVDYQDSDSANLYGAGASETQFTNGATNRPAVISLGGTLNAAETLGVINFFRSGNDNGYRSRAMIAGVVTDGGTANQHGGYLSFRTAGNGDLNPIEVVRIAQFQNVELKWRETAGSRYGFLYSKEALHLTNNSYYSSGWLMATTGPASQFVADSDGSLLLRVAPSNTENNATTWQTKARIWGTDRTNFAIGTSTALAEAVNRGNITINGNSNSILAFGVSDVLKGYLYNNGTSFYMNMGAGDMIFEGNTATPLYLNQNGFVGIRTVPLYQLSVNGSNNGIDFETNVSSTYARSIFFTTRETGVAREIGLTGGYSYGPSNPLTMVLTQTSDTPIAMFRASDDAVGAGLKGYKGRGTVATPASVANGDTIFSMEGWAIHGSGPNHAKFGAGMRFVKEDAFGTANTYAPQRTEFYNAVSTTAVQTNVVIYPNGNTTFGSSTYYGSYKLYVEGIVASNSGFLINSGQYNSVAEVPYTGMYMTGSSSSDGFGALLISSRTDTSRPIVFGTYNGTALGERARITGVGEFWLGYTSDQGAYLLQVNGTIYASGDVIAYSDASVKNNIRPIDNVLSRILNSRGVLYDRTDKDEKNNIGFIAQELEQQFPELVSTNTDGTKGVKYQNAVAVLFEAVKEQQKQIEELKNKLN